jgi:hypothetical protein
VLNNGTKPKSMIERHVQKWNVALRVNYCEWEGVAPGLPLEMVLQHCNITFATQES